MGVVASQISSLMIVYSTIYSGSDQRKHQSSASLAFVRGIHRLLVNSPHKGPVTRKMFPFDDVIMHLQKRPCSSPRTMRFGVSFMSSKSDLFLAIVMAVLYIISWHHSDVIMGAVVSQITTIFYSTIYSGSDQRKLQSSTSLAFVRGIHLWLVNSLHKRPVMRKMFPFDDVIMDILNQCIQAPTWWYKVLKWIPQIIYETMMKFCLISVNVYKQK